jgi:hypothetical protein
VTVDGSGFKFLPTNDWKGDFGKSKTTAGLMAQNDEDNISVETDGFYRIRADYNTMTYKVDAVTWGIYGTATPGGTTTSTSMEFANPAKGQYTWSVDANLIVGTLKFRANNTNTINMGDTGNNGSLEYGGTAIPVAAAGNYRITLTLNAKLGYSYSITAN